jgi:SEC-C motif-containing protein
MALNRNEEPKECPCRSGQLYAKCCAPAHAGMPAATAEALMRSRYSAFVLRRDQYLFETWHPRTRPTDIRLLRHDPPPKWLGLEVRHMTTEGDRATVEFVARYRSGGGPATRMHETSRFEREGGRWYYVDGEQH